MPYENSSINKITDHNLIAIIPAAGSGDRLGLGLPKALAEVNGETILTRTLTRFLTTSIFSRIIVTAPFKHFNVFERSLQRSVELAGKILAPSVRDPRHRYCVIPDLIVGGSTRADSVKNALDAIDRREPEETIVLLHDAARIFVSEQLIRRCIEVAVRSGAASVAVPIVDTVRRASAIEGLSQLGQVVDRGCLWGMQTPQAFKLSLLRLALDRCEKNRLPTTIVSDDPALRGEIPPSDDHLYMTDEVGMVQRLVPVEYILGSPLNFKITTQADLEMASLLQIISESPPGGKN